MELTAEAMLNHLSYIRRRLFQLVRFRQYWRITARKVYRGGFPRGSIKVTAGEKPLICRLSIPSRFEDVPKSMVF